MGKKETGEQAPAERDFLGFTSGERFVAIAVVGLWAFAATLSLFDRSDRQRHEANLARLAFAAQAPDRPPHRAAPLYARIPFRPPSVASRVAAFDAPYDDAVPEEDPVALALSLDPSLPPPPERHPRRQAETPAQTAVKSRDPAPSSAASGQATPQAPTPTLASAPAANATAQIQDPILASIAAVQPVVQSTTLPAIQPETQPKDKTAAYAAASNGNGTSVLWLASLGDRVNVRAQPNLKGQVLRQLDRGNLVGHLDSTDSWIKVKIPDQDKLVGWVHASLLAEQEADLGQNFSPNRSIAGEGFGNFWYEADRLVKETGCDLPEFTLGDRTHGPALTCRLGPGGPGGVGRLQVKGQPGNIKIDHVALTWQGVPGAPVFFAEGPPELQGVVGKLGTLYGGLPAERMALILEKNLGRDAKVDAFRYKADTTHRADGQDWELKITDEEE
ncbi:MAG: SH3 domain-containing protein [Pseudomonadota bacterium]